MREQEILRIVTKSLLIAVLIGLGLWLAWTVRSVLVVLFVATVLAAGLSSVVDALAGVRPRRDFLRVPRVVALLALYLFLIGGLVLIGVGVVPPLAREANALISVAPAYLGATGQWLQTMAATYPFLQGLDEWLRTHAGDVFGNLGDLSAQTAGVLRFALGVVNGIVAFVLVLVITFYLIVDSGALRHGILALLPHGSRRGVESMAERVRVKIGGWLIGQLLLSTIIGTGTFVGLYVIGVPYALFLAVIAAVGELIPMLGPIIAAVPAVIVATFVSPVHGLITVALYIVIQQLENHLVVPQVMRRAVDLPPVVTILALLMGSEVLGIIGAILALPTAAAASVVIDEIIALRRRELPAAGPPPAEHPGPGDAEGA